MAMGVAETEEGVMKLQLQLLASTLEIPTSESL